MSKLGERRSRELSGMPPKASSGEKVNRAVNSVDLTKPVGRFNNLRMRPFLVVEIYALPSEKANTKKKDWQKIKGNIRSSEQHSIVNRVSRKTMVRGEAIIDIVNDCLIKNRFDNQGEDPVAFDKQILAHFKTKYSDIITRSKTVWMAENAVASAKEALRKVAA